MRPKPKRKQKQIRPLTDRQMFDQAVDAVGYWSDEAARWKDFASVTQDVCVQLQRQVDALQAEVRRLSAPRVGCDECDYTGLITSPVDDILHSGAVVHRRILCPNCRPVLDEFVDNYIQGII